MPMTDSVEEALITDESLPEDEEFESDNDNPDERFEDAIHNAKSGRK